MSVTIQSNDDKNVRKNCFKMKLLCVCKLRCNNIFIKVSVYKIMFEEREKKRTKNDENGNEKKIQRCIEKCTFFIKHI